MWSVFVWNVDMLNRYFSVFLQFVYILKIMNNLYMYVYVYVCIVYLYVCNICICVYVFISWGICIIVLLL